MAKHYFFESGGNVAYNFRAKLGMTTFFVIVLGQHLPLHIDQSHDEKSFRCIVITLKNSFLTNYWKIDFRPTEI